MNISQNSARDMMIYELGSLLDNWPGPALRFHL